MRTPVVVLGEDPVRRKGEQAVRQIQSYGTCFGQVGGIDLMPYLLVLYRD